ncbi:hypothetical protein EV702DRAFT_1194091 [Suillus placidus]|uniref:Uncharacterized protein n=1 Tax=Suillus placidus TaxID=48579 RepID=A0A9P7D6Q4_9AGAM|nr:hypothetical protein EV702DRAFT_1194091 [Suillus placidus]
MRSRLLSVATGSSPLENILQLSSAAVIIFEHSFYIFDKQRYLHGQKGFDPSVRVALEQYMASPHAVAVRESVGAAICAYQEAMKTAIYTHQRGLPAWTAKLRFKRSQEKKAKAELIETLFEITLNHRLPRL